jgi:hypothetical protein
MATSVDFSIDRNDTLGLYEGVMKVSIPEITVTRFKASRDDFQYEMRNAVTEIVGEIVDKAMKDF